MQSPERPAVAKQRPARRTKELRISQRGLEYPHFPAAPVKKLATSFMKSQGNKARLSADTLAVLMRTTDDFFEQIGIDLAAYAQHGGRQAIEESDVIALMKRYVTFSHCTVVYKYRFSFLTIFRTRKTTNNNNPFSIAQKMLPRELLQQLRKEPPVKLRGPRRRHLNSTEEDEEE